MLARQGQRILRMFCTKQQSFETQVNINYLRTNIEYQKASFEQERVNEMIQLFGKPIIGLEEKSKYMKELSEVIINNKNKLTDRYFTNQIIRKYFVNKWPCVDSFHQIMIEHGIEQFQNNYIELDEGHNLYQFFRAIILSQIYTEKQIAQIAELFNQHYLRINLKHAIISLYYANLSGHIDKFEILVKIIDELSLFAEFSQLSTLVLIMETIQNEKIINQLNKIVIRMQSEFLLKETNLSSKIIQSRFDALQDYLQIHQLITPEFQEFCYKERDNLKANHNQHSLAKFLTRDQEEVFEKVYSKYENDNNNINELENDGDEINIFEDGSEDLLIDKLLKQRKK